MRKLAAIALLFAGRAAWGQDPAPEPPALQPPRHAEADTSKDFVRLAFNFYSQKDGGGNPHLEEDMTVLEPQILVSKTISPSWTLTAKFQADIISAASVEHGKRFPIGTQSGASGDRYAGYDVGAFYAWSDQTTIGAGLSFSNEYDYASAGGYLKWSHSTESRNDTFVVRLSSYFDTLDMILFDGSERGSEDRQSLSLGLGWTHVLGPSTVGTLNWDITRQQGFLSTPYNSVVTALPEAEEALPDNRFRNALFARVRHLVSDSFALEPGIGAYFDDWGGSAFSLEAAAFWEPLPGAMILRGSYRYHWQAELDYFLDDTAVALPEFRTQDSDLAAFTSHTFGLKVVFPRVSLFGDNQEIELGFDYTMRSDDLDAFSVTMGYQWRF